MSTISSYDVAFRSIYMYTNYVVLPIDKYHIPNYLKEIQTKIDAGVLLVKPPQSAVFSLQMKNNFYVEIDTVLRLKRFVTELHALSFCNISLPFRCHLCVAH
jgi:hypothetical protein